jgi:putative restriction endonuclease
VKLIFDTRPGSRYDDAITHQYHFPDKAYLPTALAGVGDLIVYREPSREGGRGRYFATARLVKIEPDLKTSGHSYARVDQYFPFDSLQALEKEPGVCFESPLNEVPRTRRGSALRGNSVRTVSDLDFAAIVLAGIHKVFDPERARALNLEDAQIDEETARLLRAPPAEKAREIRQILVNRKIRDAAFRGWVCDAYEDTCAVTRLHMTNGGGKAEVQAAHIWSVADGGPDVVQNGIALAGTVHWLFDRHLISLTDDYGLLVSHNKVPSELRPLFQRQLERIHLPTDKNQHPHLDYVRRHREKFV